MNILIPSGWQDYELLDCGSGKRLERFGKYVLSRPDPQCIWKPYLPSSQWEKADAQFIRTSEDRGKWKVTTKIPEKWLMHYKDLSFYAKLSPFKHTGIFPEQSVQWDFIEEKISHAKREIRVLNLFSYTGISSLAAANAGGKVTHVDASYASIGWAKENAKASNLPDNAIRWIEDDVLKFIEREVRRESVYDAIIMDPPAFGHGPDGEIWKFNEQFPTLLENCKKILTPSPLFILINAYAISSSCIMLENMLKDLNLEGTINVGELALEQTSGRLLSTGIYGRWTCGL